MSLEHEKLQIVFDTNAIKNLQPDFNSFSLNLTFEKAYDFITMNKLNFITLHIPRICIDELINQYCEEYKDQIIDTRKKYDEFLVEAKKLGWSSELTSEELQDDTYLVKIRGSAENYISARGNLNIIPLCSNEKMSCIIERAIQRKYPFFGGYSNKKKFTDAGFKDVIFLESIIEYFNHCTDNVLIVTCDNIILGLKSKDEFPDKKVKIINLDTGDKLVNYLCELYKIKDMSEHYKFCENAYFYDTINDVLGCEVTKNIVSINEVEIDDYICVDVQLNIIKSNVAKKILVRLTETHDFDEILDFDTRELMYSWK